MPDYTFTSLTNIVDGFTGNFSECHQRAFCLNIVSAQVHSHRPEFSLSDWPYAPGVQINMDAWPDSG
jgi:hypothetical protein